MNHASFLRPREPVMSEVDMNIILGNLLDNAAEAMEKAEEKYDGAIKISHENCIFKVDLMLYTQAAVRNER